MFSDPCFEYELCPSEGEKNSKHYSQNGDWRGAG